MDAKKCDRCGAFYEKYGSKKQATEIKIINGDDNNRCACDRSYELCPECMREVETWINAKRDTADDQSGGAENAVT